MFNKLKEKLSGFKKKVGNTIDEKAVVVEEPVVVESPVEETATTTEVPVEKAAPTPQATVKPTIEEKTESKPKKIVKYKPDISNENLKKYADGVNNCKTLEELRKYKEKCHDALVRLVDADEQAAKAVYEAREIKLKKESY